MRRFLLPAAVFLFVILAALYYWPAVDTNPPASRRSPAPDANSASRANETRPTAFGPEGPDTKTRENSPAPGSAPTTATFREEDFPIAAPLNAPNRTIADDLQVVQQLFDGWRTNFPHDGNPVGENADITAALMGDNRLGLVLVPKGHRAVNARGELCDRWGTPFRFHQLSGSKMEIRSAGPDRKFATGDDSILTPE
jgi:hypothetical protein